MSVQCSLSILKCANMKEVASASNDASYDSDHACEELFSALNGRDSHEPKDTLSDTLASTAEALEAFTKRKAAAVKKKNKKRKRVEKPRSTEIPSVNKKSRGQLLKQSLANSSSSMPINSINFTHSNNRVIKTNLSGSSSLTGDGSNATTFTSCNVSTSSLLTIPTAQLVTKPDNIRNEDTSSTTNFGINLKDISYTTLAPMPVQNRTNCSKAISFSTVSIPLSTANHFSTTVAGISNSINKFFTPLTVPSVINGCNSNSACAPSEIPHQHSATTQLNSANTSVVVQPPNPGSSAVSHSKNADYYDTLLSSHAALLNSAPHCVLKCKTKARASVWLLRNEIEKLTSENRALLNERARQDNVIDDLNARISYLTGLVENNTALARMIENVAQIPGVNILNKPCEPARSSAFSQSEGSCSDPPTRINSCHSDLNRNSGVCVHVSFGLCAVDHSKKHASN